jgi:hypothetical protein
MLVAMAGCTSGSSAAHYRVRGEARHSWPAAARQILQGDSSKNGCGIPNPTAQQIESAAELLKQFGIKEVEDANCWGTFRFDPSTPQGVDVENCGIGSSRGSETSVALPPGFCPTPEPVTPPKPDAGTVEDVAQDAGTQDAGAVEAKAPDAGTQPIPPLQPEAGTEGPDTQPAVQEDAGTPEEVAPPPPNPLAQAKSRLRSKINTANQLVQTLQTANLNSEATILQNAINETDDYLSSSSRSEVEEAIAQLNAAITRARKKLGM